MGSQRSQFLVLWMSFDDGRYYPWGWGHMGTLLSTISQILKSLTLWRVELFPVRNFRKNHLYLKPKLSILCDHLQEGLYPKCTGSGFDRRYFGKSVCEKVSSSKVICSVCFLRIQWLSEVTGPAAVTLSFLDSFLSVTLFLLTFALLVFCFVLLWFFDRFLTALKGGISCSFL